jgi:FMN phosphatase YigB (HAD superfamily)
VVQLAVFSVPDTVLFDLRGTLVDPSTGWRFTDAQRIRFLRAGGARATEAQLRINLERAITDVNALTFQRRAYFEQDRLVLARAAALSGIEVPEPGLEAFERWRNRAFARVRSQTRSRRCGSCECAALPSAASPTAAVSGRGGCSRARDCSRFSTSSSPPRSRVK